MYLDYDDRLSYFYAIKVRLHIQARLYGKQLFTSGKFKVFIRMWLLFINVHFSFTEDCKEAHLNQIGC